jgi:hypothetical protein
MGFSKFTDLFAVFNGNSDITESFITNGLPSDTTNVSVKVKFDFWSQGGITALGQGSGGVGATTLYGLSDVRKNATEDGVYGAIEGNVLTYNSTLGKWEGRAVQSGTDMTTVWANLAASTSEQINASHLSTALSGYATQSWVSNTLSPYATQSWVGQQGFLTSIAAATTSALGGIKVGYTTSGKNYKVQLDSSNNAYVNVPWENTTYDLSGYLLKSGGTMTGILTLWGSQYNAYDTGNGALNLNNSDITGVNSILTADLSDSWKESIGFKRTNGNYDTFRAADGTFYFGVNNGTEYTALHSGNSSVSKSGETLTVKINGTSYSLTNTNTTYTASTGLSLSGTAFSVSYAPKVLGSYTSNGGQQNPNYFGTNRVRFLMMNTTVNSNSQYKDWIIMDCYSGNDVGGGVAIGVNRQSLGAYIMRSAAARTSWAESAELLGTHNSSVSLSGSTLTVKIAGVEKSLTNTNTWRGIQDNLTSSTNTTESLSAKQGYLLANGSARDSTKLPLAGGTMTGALGKSSNYLIKPVADYRTSSDTHTGCIAITLPATIGNTMVSMWIDVYNYSTNTSFSVHCGGYTYNNSTWANNPFAMVYGASHRVRLGHNGTSFVIYVGETNSTWHYPQVTVRDVVLGFGQTYANWYKDWTISFVTSVSNVTADYTRYAITSSNIGSQSVNYATSAGKATNDSDGNAINSTYLKKSGGTLSGFVSLSNANAKLSFGDLSTSPITGYKAPSLGSLGIGLYSRYGASSDEGAIIITEDTCVIYNSSDTGWNFQVMDKDLGTDMTNDTTRSFGVNSSHQAFSLGGFVKSGSSDSYVLLGGGGHLQISDSNTNSTIVKRTGSGYIYGTYFNQSSSAETPTTSSYLMYANSDGFLRKSTLADVRKILYPKLATANYGTSGSTTKIKININSTATWMLCFVVTLYQGYRATKIMISGYQYGSNHWYQPEARLLGDSDNTETISVYFGYDDTNKLWVGFDGGSYTGVLINDVTNGYTQIDNYEGLFTISNVSSLATLQTTVTAASRANYASSAGAVAWSNVSSKPSAAGGATTPVYWTGSGFTACTAYENAYVKSAKQVYDYVSGAGGFFSSAQNGLGSGTGALVFAYGNNPILFYSNSSERMRVTGTGDVGIGTTSPSYKLDVSGAIRSTGASVCSAIEFLSISGSAGHGGYIDFHYNGSSADYTSRFIEYSSGTVTLYGNFYASGGVTAASDIRLKDVLSYQLPLTVEQVAQAPTIKFLWKNKREEGEQVGSVAQYWQKVLPQSVSEENNELGLSYGVAALISAITTARKVVDHEARIKALEKECERLRTENEQLKLKIA